MNVSIIVQPACPCESCSEADALAAAMDSIGDELEHAMRYERAGLKRDIFHLWKKARTLRSRCKRKR